jgi:hypothetical protein
MEGSGTKCIGWNKLQNADFEAYEGKVKDPQDLDYTYFLF